MPACQAAEAEARCDLETCCFFAGVLLICVLFSEAFPRALQRLQALLRRRPRLKYAAYPLGVLLAFGAAALIAHALVNFALTGFSYD